MRYLLPTVSIMRASAWLLGALACLLLLSPPLFAASDAPAPPKEAPASPHAPGDAKTGHPTAGEQGRPPDETRPALLPGTIIKMPEGKPVTFDQMMRDLRFARVVYMGENHDNMAHHENQLAIIRGLQERVGSVAVGMEMFQRPCQKVLDDWVAGKLNEKELIAQTQWYGRWSVDFTYYEPILEDARQGHKRVLALNATDELVRAVAVKGVDNLPKEQRQELPEMDLDHSEHRHFIEHMFEAQAAGHHHSSFERFYEAQRVWDETMAETIAKYLSTPGAAQTVAVLAGNGHVEYGLGMPGDVFRRLAVPYRVVSFQAVGQVTWGPGPGPPVAMCDYGRPLADYVWVTTEPPEEDKPKLGVTVEPPGKGEHGAKVEAVLKGSPAHKAGVKPCDVILAVNGEEVNSVGELRYVLSHKQMGDRVTVEVLREGKKASLEATLSPLPKKRGKGDELICPR